VSQKEASTHKPSFEPKEVIDTTQLTTIKHEPSQPTVEPKIALNTAPLTTVKYEPYNLPLNQK